MATALIILIALVVVESLARLVTVVSVDGLGYRNDYDLPRSPKHHVLEGLG